MNVGIGTVDIKPDIGARTEIFQNLKVDKVVTPLLLKVVLFRSGDISFAFVSADVMDFFEDSINDIREIVGSITGTPENNIFLNSSHTHSAPYIYPSAQRYLEKWETGFLDMDYYKKLLESVDKAAKQAVQNLKEVRLKHSRGIVEGVGCNRRVELEDGSIGIRYGRGVPEELRKYPDGIIDPYVECIWIEDTNGILEGVIMNYACHGTSYNQYSHICWDYMGFARQYVEEQLGGQAIFLQGCAGNVSPGKYTVTEPLEDAITLGKRLAKAVIGSYKERKIIKSKDISVFNQKLILKGRTTLSKDQLEEKLKMEIESVISKNRNANTDPSGVMVISYVERILMAERYPDMSIMSEIGIAKIGDITMVFLPGECFIQYAIEIKKYMEGKPVLVMAYSDCTLQYIPDKKAYSDKGGYETDPNWCYSKEGNGEVIVESVKELIRKDILCK